MKIRVGETTYTPAALDRITLRNLMKLEAETAALGRPMRWSDLRNLANNVGGMKGEDAAQHDDFPWYLGMLIWAARLEAGEAISFTDAVDVPMGDLEFIPDPEDDEAARPPKARPASGRAGARQPADRRPKKKASARPSSAA